MLLFSVTARILKAESRRQNSWPRNPPVCCFWDCAAKFPRKRSVSSCGCVEGSKGSTGDQGAETTCEKRQKGWFGTMACLSVCAGAPGIRTQPSALASTPATCHRREQVLEVAAVNSASGVKGAGVSGCCYSFKPGKLERLLYSKTCLKYIYTNKSVNVAKTKIQYS